MGIALRTDGEGNRRALLIGGVGYGVVCGLTFPLMISNTFLREMSLSHGAGDSFGALFFLAYAAAMLALALWHGAKRRPLPRFALTVALGAVFLGNVLMMLRYFAVIDGGWPYAITTGASIGFGLATAELGWMERLVRLEKNDGAPLSRTISLAYLLGGGATAVIFFASGPVELSFALALVLLSGALLARTPAAVDCQPAQPPRRADRIGLVKAISYLAVFSFVFGAVSQMAETSGTTVVVIEMQATGSVIGAALIFFIASFWRTRVIPVADLYGILFPVVAAALIALPFIATPWVHGVASVLVFAAFYLSGMNVRIIVSQLSRGDRISLWVYLGCALGIGSLLVIAGVAFGAAVLAQGNPETALALVALISLFILAMNPVVAARIERRGTAGASAPEGERPDEEGAAEDRGFGAAASPGTVPLEAVVGAFAREHAMTAREEDVLRLLCQGRTRTYIADELGLSPNTVKGYIRNVYQKSGSVDKQDLLDRVELFRDRL